ncbi:protein SULFUR DEFICIENCY-INDUCED 1-like isoform X2 [Phragmites australis]|uniref:protein SULFUR DEFICIENCY-INDUCED 1-like isoform X2 n=1 Tax=Phragmites australis TaxID=29695 RepID=UPI002D76E54B|nr:protein SULFUR DEFICIENCY-INDUCED 1-like isoform X2 [Phragmites australis]
MASSKMRGGGGVGGEKNDLFHVVHKVPAGDSPYVRAKHLQLVEKQPDMAIVWFWKAINSGDRVDSALKDMVVVMKQQDRSEEAIEAIRSFRHLCSKQAQESLDNLLIDLYKCGKVEEQIELLKQKLKMIYLGEAFNGKATKKARSHGKKFQVSIQQETSRILGNLGWAYMQQNNYEAAELVYRKAQSIEPDANRVCNLGLCLIKQGRHEEAKQELEDVLLRRTYGSDDAKVVARAEQLLRELNPLMHVSSPFDVGLSVSEEIMERLDLVMNEWTPFRSRRLPVFEEIATFRDQITC